MASQSETGHAKNLANLKLLNDLLIQLGATYNPTNNLLSMASITALITQCQTDYDGWANKLTIYKVKTDLREIAFEPISKLVTAINSSVQQLNEPQQTFNDVQAFVSKIHGAEKKIKANAAVRLADPSTTPPLTDPNPLPTDPISTSQQSYDSVVKNFDLLIQRLQTIPTYTPNETALQIANLQTQYANLNVLNADAGSATNSLNIARNQRNLTFYAPQTGLYDITLKIKKYLKSNTATQNAYSQATKLKFVKIIQRKKKKAN
jgi:hypothetical protein